MTQEALFPIRNAKAQRNRGAYGSAPETIGSSNGSTRKC